MTMEMEYEIRKCESCMWAICDDSGEPVGCCGGDGDCPSIEEVLKEYEHYTPSATRGDYSPANPWDAPGMKVSDFI